VIDEFLAINRECESQLWPLTESELRELLDIAYHVKVTNDGLGMLLAFDERAPYDNPNHQWFRERYSQFVYVDRVAVSEKGRGRGIARSLYEELIAKARADGHAVLCAEIYSDPPNPKSDAFHEAMGFAEVGTAFLADRGKSVRYLVKRLD
jgi:uncharacterized protein